MKGAAVMAKTTATAANLVGDAAVADRERDAQLATRLADPRHGPHHPSTRSSRSRATRSLASRPSTAPRTRVARTRPANALR